MQPKAAIFSDCSSASRWRCISAAAARASRRAATWRGVFATVASRSAKSIGFTSFLLLKFVAKRWR